MFGDTLRRRWFALALLLWALAASRLALSAATVTGTIYGADGDLFTGTMLFRTLRTPLVSGSTLVTGGDYRVSLTNGALSTTLLAGDYRAFIGADQKGFIIAVPSGSGSYSILGLITNAITYTDQSYPWESTPPATASVSGTVKTDVDEGNPVVYLKSSIDALLATNAAPGKLDITNGAAVNLTVNGAGLLLMPAFDAEISQVVSPAAYQVFQRSTTTNGPITITAYIAGPTGTELEARYNAGTWTSIGTSDSDGLVTGTLTNCAVIALGADVDLRLAGTTNVTTVTPVAVGDVFAIWGQSNGSGRLEANQSYTNSAAVLASMLGNNYEWAALTDPTDEDDGQVDEISIDTDSERGSVWPLVANITTVSNSVPVAFVQCTRGGTGFSGSQPTWVPQTDRFDRDTLFGSALYRTRESGARAVIWWQGEGWSSTSNLYYSNVTNMIGAAVAEIPALKFIPISLQEVVGATNDQTNTWTAINWLWNAGNSAILNGPTLATIPVGGTDNILTEDEGAATPWYHLKSSTNAQSAALRIATNLLTNFP